MTTVARELTRRGWLARDAPRRRRPVVGASGGSRGRCTAVAERSRPGVRLLPEHQHAPRAEADDRRGSQDRVQGRLRSARALDSRADDHVKAGGSLDALGREIQDRKLSVESAIGFFEWAVDDDDETAEGDGRGRRNFEMVRSSGRQAARRAAGRPDDHQRRRPAQGRRPLPRTARAGRPVRRRPRGRGLGLLEDPGPFGRGGVRRHRERAPPRLHPARRLPPVQRRVEPPGAVAAQRRRDPRLPHERLPRRPDRAPRSRTSTASIPATASPRSPTCCGSSGRSVSTASSHSSFSTAATGSRTRGSSPAPAWKRCARSSARSPLRPDPARSIATRSAQVRGSSHVRINILSYRRAIESFFRNL